MNFDNIPNYSYIEQMLPIQKISELAKLEGNSKKPVYTLHKWWARRLSSVVRSLIIGSLLPANSTEDVFWDAYYSKNTLNNITVLDTFMGGGTCIVEAQKMGANVIGVDVDNLACLITKKELEPLYKTELVNQFNRIIINVESRIKKYYYTKVNNELCEVVNFFWAYEIECKKCGSHILSHPHFYLAKDNNSIIAFCKHCGTIEILPANRKRIKCKKCNKTTDINKGHFSKGILTCSNCSEKHYLKEHISGKNNLHLFALEYISNGKRYYKIADEYDKNLLMEASLEYKMIKHTLKIPNEKIPPNQSGDARPQSHGYLKYKDLFNDRQLLSIGILYNEILKISDNTAREWLLLAFSDCLASNNMLCCYAYGYKKLTPLFGIHAYTIPARPVENNLIGTDILGRGTFKKTFFKMIKGKQYCSETYETKIVDGKKIKVTTGEKIEANVTNNSNDFYMNKRKALILNQSSERLNQIRDNSIDFILTDPPYYDNLAYSELSAFFSIWAESSIEREITNQSIFVGTSDDKSNESYIVQLTNVFIQCYLKLKENGIMVFSFHHNKLVAWTSLAIAIKNAKFKVTNVFPIRSEGNSAYHSSEDSIKWDSIIVMRKHSQITYDKVKYNKLLQKCINELHMKSCDITSFKRSIKVMNYVNEKQDIHDINAYFEQEI